MKKRNLNHKILSLCFLVFSACVLLIACSKKADNNGSDSGLMPTIGPDLVFFALTDDAKLNRYNAKAPGTVEASLTLSGLSIGEKLLSIDFRPATYQLYALSSNSRLYTINLTDGSLRVVGTGFTPVLNAQVANIDFNPTVDRIRLVTNTGQNLRLHPETGAAVATDGNINGGVNPSITSIAYTNSRSGATSTDLFDIDIAQKKLYKQIPPNDGTLVEVGNLGIDFTGKGGFDISPDNAVSLATFTQLGKTRLHSINLTTGKSTYINEIAANIVDIAIPTPPTAYGVDESNTLHIFDPTKPQMTITKTISGLIAGETIHGLDFRPATGELYAFTTDMNGMGKLYKINTASGAAAAVGTGFMVGTQSTAWGFDFNPTVDRIRLISNTGLNLRLNPNDGTIAATDGVINPGNPTVTAAAYTNNFAGTTSTILYVMNNTKLFKQDPPNNGTLVETGNLGVTIDAISGFDIGGRSGIGYVTASSGTGTIVYTANLTSGALTVVGNMTIRLRAFALGLGM